MADAVFRAESGIYAGANSTVAATLVVTGNVFANTSSVYANRVGIMNSSNVSVVYQIYNPATNSLDTIFG